MGNSTRLLGGIAYIVLIVFSFIGEVAAPLHIITLIAAICVLIAFIRAGDELGRPTVKRNIITAIVLYIVTWILVIFLVGAGVVALMHGSVGGATAFGVGAIVGGIIAWLLAIAAGWFWYQASVPLAEATGVSLYKTGGLLIFIGAILLVVFGIGAIVMLIGEILQCIAFFTTPEKNVVTIETPSA